VSEQVFLRAKCLYHKMNGSIKILKNVTYYLKLHTELQKLL